MTDHNRVSIGLQNFLLQGRSFKVVLSRKQTTSKEHVHPWFCILGKHCRSSSEIPSAVVEPGEVGLVQWSNVSQTISTHHIGSVNVAICACIWETSACGLVHFVHIWDRLKECLIVQNLPYTTVEYSSQPPGCTQKSCSDLQSQLHGPTSIIAPSNENISDLPEIHVNKWKHEQRWPTFLMTILTLRSCEHSFAPKYIGGILTFSRVSLGVLSCVLSSLP